MANFACWQNMHHATKTTDNQRYCIVIIYFQSYLQNKGTYSQSICLTHGLFSRPWSMKNYKNIVRLCLLLQIQLLCFICFNYPCCADLKHDLKNTCYDQDILFIGNKINNQKTTGTRIQFNNIFMFNCKFSAKLTLCYNLCYINF